MKMNLAEAIRQSVALMQAGRQAESLALCRKVLEAAPGQPDALHLLAIAARDRGDAASAEELFQQALSAAPRRADILVNFGNFLSALGRQREARSRLSRAVDVDPTLLSGLYPLGLLSLQTGDIPEAKRCATMDVMFSTYRRGRPYRSNNPTTVGCIRRRSPSCCASNLGYAP